MNDKNRIYYFMGGTLAVGLLVALFMFLSGNGTPPPITGGATVVAATNHKELQSKVDEVNIENVSPTSYNTLRTEILSSYQAKTITEVWKTNLLSELEQKYTDLTLQKINKYFLADPVNEAAMQPLISHLESLGKAQKEIAAMRSKISQINYYTNTLPAKVNSFIAPGYNKFNDNTYLSLKSELESVSKLDSYLSKRSSVVIARNSALSKLKSYFSKYIDYKTDMKSVQINNPHLYNLP